MTTSKLTPTTIFSYKEILYMKTPIANVSKVVFIGNKLTKDILLAV